MRVNGTELDAAEAAFGKRFEMAWRPNPQRQAYGRQLRRKPQHLLDEVVRCKRGYRGASKEQRTIHDFRLAHCPLTPLTPQHRNPNALGSARHPWPVHRNGKPFLAAMIGDGRTSALPASASRDRRVTCMPNLL